ncbi:uncharacterized protein LOC128738714 [Sabethes cyaneus]|uniref:uncharacterized protein LOC128738714 n=1 Tax=Sabethes cyaneus TaxID=53552 RepID=UPI00237E8586|nr:uncharacterized protein LOC128738714 [Sabethes cyaneus]
MARNQKTRRSAGLRKTPRRSIGNRLSKPKLPDIRESNRRKMKRVQKRVQQRLLRRSLEKEKRKQRNNNQPSSSGRTMLYPPIAPPPPPNHLLNRPSTSRSPQRQRNRAIGQLKTMDAETIVIDSEDDSLVPPEPVPLFYEDTLGGFNDKEVPSYDKVFLIRTPDTPYPLRTYVPRYHAEDNDGEQTQADQGVLMESMLEEGEIRDADETCNAINNTINAEEIPISDDEVDLGDQALPTPKRADSEDCSVIFCSEVIDLDRDDTAKEKALEFIPIGFELDGQSRKKRTPRKKRNNNGSNTANAENATTEETTSKRMVVIDGNNVAFGHTCGQGFSVKGLEICIQHFKKMGHEVNAVVPQFRLKKDKSTDQKLLEKLYKDGDVLLAPSKNLPGQRSSSYDDRLIISVAEKFDGVVISNDNFRDLLTESDSWKKIIETRVIGYTWAKDAFFLPDDPYGRHGPKLKDLLECSKSPEPKPVPVVAAEGK